MALKRVSDIDRQLEKERIESDEDLLITKSSNIVDLDIGLTSEDFFGDKIVGLSIAAIGDLINYSTVGRVDGLLLKQWSLDAKSKIKIMPMIQLSKDKVAQLSDYEWTQLNLGGGRMPAHVQVKMFLRLHNEGVLSYKEIVNLGLDTELLTDIVYMLKFGYEEREQKIDTFQKLIDSHDEKRKNTSK